MTHLLWLCAWLLCATQVTAATLEVGSTRALKTPAAAALVAKDGDTVLFDPQSFPTGGATWNAPNLTLKSVGGRATIAGPAVEGKALFLLKGNDVVIDGLIFQGAVVPDGNGAGIRTENKNYTIRNSVFRYNQMGILTGGPEAATVGSVIIIENSEFYQNGTGDGYTHNSYISKGTTLIFRHNWSYCSNGGQLLKTRTAVSVVVNNRFVDPPGCNSNQEVDFSNGGDVTFVGNVVRQDQNTTNSSVVTFLAEGPAANTVHRLVFSANTIIQERDPVGPFVHYRGVPSGTTAPITYTPPEFVEFVDNVFVGKGTTLAYTAPPLVQAPQPLPPNNLVIPLLADARFVDAANQQYRPGLTSPLVDKGGHVSAATRALLATQYAHPTRSHPRTQQGAAFDLGAYEAGDVPPAGPLAAPYLTGALGTPPSGTLRWWPATVEGATGIKYEVQKNNAVLATQAGLTYTEALQPGLPTAYKVTALVGDQRSPVSNVVTLTLPIKQPTIPDTVGWAEITGTNFNTACKTYNTHSGHTGCRSIVDAYSSAAFDPIKQRLLLFGGGHKDYFGNEVYAVNLATTAPTITRLTAPTQPYTTYEYCAEGLPYLLSPTGVPLPYTAPSSRHTFDGLIFVPHANTFLSFGGALACYASWTSNSFWLLNMATLQWEERQPQVELWNAATNMFTLSTQPLVDRPQRQEGAMLDYDAKEKVVLLHDKVCLYTYNLETNVARRLSCQKPAGLPQLGYINTGIFDPTTRKFHVLGAKEHYVFSVDAPYTAARVGLVGDHTMANAYYPGLTYDTLRKEIVGFDGGDSIWRFDPTKNQWFPLWFAGGPGARNPTGTYKRFTYVPSQDIYWLVNNGNQNMFTLRRPPVLPPVPGAPLAVRDVTITMPE